MDYIPRILETQVRHYLDIFPAVGITGPRQSGKSTMIKTMLGTEFRYVTFDDFRMVDFFHADPMAFLKEYRHKVIFDEVQKVPEIFTYLKQHIDEQRDIKGQFVLTGSSQFTFIQGLTETMAGRIGLLTLLPFQYSEIPENLRDLSIYLGTYPELIIERYRNHPEWYESYIETFIMKDVRTLLNVGDLHDFRRFINLLASRTAQLLNYSLLASDVGVSVSTIKRWISVLEASHIIFVLQPFYRNLGSRIIKSPKMYFNDTGLVCFLTGIINKTLYEKGPMAGAVFENFVISEIRKTILHAKTGHKYYFYRTSNGFEVDIILEKQGTLDLIEIKNSSTFRTAMIKPVEKLMEPGFSGKLVYTGETMPYKTDLQVVSYKKYLAKTENL
ncbi:MAG: ATP-binding protein [Bacteroidetes bacterium]|nr:ATP-binding protein [Bacteroidota bacterium]